MIKKDYWLYAAAVCFIIAFVIIPITIPPPALPILGGVMCTTQTNIQPNIDIGVILVSLFSTLGFASIFAYMLTDGLESNTSRCPTPTTCPLRTICKAHGGDGWDPEKGAKKCEGWNK